MSYVSSAVEQPVPTTTNVRERGFVGSLKAGLMAGAFAMTIGIGSGAVPNATNSYVRIHDPGIRHSVIEPDPINLLTKETHSTTSAPLSPKSEITPQLLMRGYGIISNARRLDINTRSAYISNTLTSSDTVYLLLRSARRLQADIGVYSSMLESLLPSNLGQHYGGAFVPQVHLEKMAMGVAPIEATLERIRSFADLESRWDDEQAVPITATSVAESALLLAISAAEGVFSRGVSVDAVPVAAGGILMEWRHPERRLQTYVGPDGALTGLDIIVENGMPIDWIDLFSVSRLDVQSFLKRMIHE